MKFAIGIIVYNPDSLVLKRIEEYFKITDQLYIYDNSEVLNDNSKNIKKLSNKYYWGKNDTGMTGALNYLFSTAKDQGIDYLLTMDQDSEFPNNDILRMLNLIENGNNSDISIYCPNYRKIYDNNGRDEYGNTKIEMDLQRFVNFSMTSASFSKVNDIYPLLPLSDLFIGYVDNEICYSLIAKGKKILMVGSIVFDQRVGYTVKSNYYNRFFKVVKHSPSRYYYMTRNNLFLQSKFKHNKKIKKELIFSLLRIYFNIIVGETNKVEKIKKCVKGYRDYKNGQFGK